MNKKSTIMDSRLAQIEQIQNELRTSIAASKALTEESEQLIARNRRQAEPAPVPPAPRPV